MLQVEGLVVRYGAVTALRGIDLSIAEGETLAVLGANGAGKSTLVRALSGIVGKVSGRVNFDGADITRDGPRRIVQRGLIQIPEGREIFTSLSVRENLHIGGFRFGHPRPDKLEQVLELFPRLRERIDQSGGTLSGGEQQMLAISRGLLAEPRLLILDEPSLGLAPVVVQQLFAVLGTLKAQGLTMLIVEQQVHHALTLADHAMLLTNGVVRMSGTAKDMAAQSGISAVYFGH
jgi:branched-chain amino acid transport system ATP-binding protein